MSTTRKFFIWSAVIFILLIIAFVLGPKTEDASFTMTMPEIEGSLDEVEQLLAARESQWDIRPDNEARIIWNDDTTLVTDYAIVYLHGFTASQEEGDPVHTEVAKAFGCNLFLSRLSMHGLVTDDQLVNLTANNYWESAKEALAYGKRLGKKVILMGTSTGGTQALQLAAAFPEDVAGLILLSPNIEINDPNAWLLNDPWGVQIARMVVGDKYISPKDTSEAHKQYWSTPYRIEAAAALQEMLENSMNEETFAHVNQPLLLMYYYKNEEEQDQVVRVDAMLDMFSSIATPEDKKVAVAIPDAGDHVIGSYIKSKDYESVIQNSESFLEEVMGINRVISSEGVEESELVPVSESL